jgi:fructose-specific component phosphotransferase system IIB-like protein
MSSFDPSALLQGTSFEPNAILRGAQLTLVGANRALQNPALFTSEHYKQAALAVAAGIGIRLLVAIPVSLSCHNNLQNR